MDQVFYRSPNPKKMKWNVNQTQVMGPVFYRSPSPKKIIWNVNQTQVMGPVPSEIYESNSSLIELDALQCKKDYENLPFFLDILPKEVKYCTKILLLMHLSILPNIKHHTRVYNPREDYVTIMDSIFQLLVGSVKPEENMGEPCEEFPYTSKAM